MSASLDQTAGDDGDATLGEFAAVADDDPEAEVVRATVSDEVRLALAQMDERDRELLSLRFGIGGDALNLDEIAGRLGVSRERVRQLEKRALSRLRHPTSTVPISLSV